MASGRRAKQCIVERTARFSAADERAANAAARSAINVLIPELADLDGDLAGDPEPEPAAQISQEIIPASPPVDGDDLRFLQALDHGAAVQPGDLLAGPCAFLEPSEFSAIAERLTAAAMISKEFNAAGQVALRLLAPGAAALHQAADRRRPRGKSTVWEWG